MNPETTERFTATHPNHVWAIDFQFDETADGRRLKLANIVDEHTREALAMRWAAPAPPMTSLATIDTLVAQRGPPGHWFASDPSPAGQ